jgi:hypothetical protein
MKMRFIIAITQFQATVARTCRMLTRCMNVSYVVGHERVSSLVLVYRVSCVNTDNLLLWICEV